MRANRGDVALSPERRVRIALSTMGFSGWHVNGRHLPGRPDVYFPNDQSEVQGLTYGHVPLAIFVDGCYWHRCPEHRSQPRTRAEFWAHKFEQNRRRDRRNERDLLELGYSTLRVWECTTRRDLGKFLVAVRRELTRGRREPHVVRLLPTKWKEPQPWRDALD